MRRWLKRAPWLLLVGAMACAYYNGLYNANRLVGEAEKAQREGRSGEARSLLAYHLAEVGFTTAPVDPFFNVNSPEDLAVAEGVLRAHAD